MTNHYDLIIIGAGSGGLTAARFAARLGARVALVEKERVGGDCTWTGCVPSKALLKTAKVAHQARTAAQYGISTGPPRTDLRQVRAYIHQTIAEVYQQETPAVLTAEGIEMVFGTARFGDAHTVRVGQRTLTAKKFIIATGAHPFIPPIPGLADVPYLTYLHIFDNATLPDRFLIIGAGPTGVEIAQAYQRLGSQVTLIDVGLLPREEPEVAETLGQVFRREDIRFVEGLVTAAKQVGNEIILTVGDEDIRGDQLLVAVGRAPSVSSLDLEKAGVDYSPKGIPVNPYLQTNVKPIYAAGDVVEGNYQFTHVAGWQAFQAAYNALLPLKKKGFSEVVPRTTFTDPEVAHVGLTEAEAHEKFNGQVRVTQWNLDQVDRAVTENDCDGFIKVVHRKNGQILGATIVAERAGETITEFALALQRGLKLIDLANVIHAYPTYSIANMQLAGEAAVDGILNSWQGPLLRLISRLTR